MSIHDPAFLEGTEDEELDSPFVECSECERKINVNSGEFILCTEYVFWNEKTNTYEATYICTACDPEVKEK